MNTPNSSPNRDQRQPLPDESEVSIEGEATVPSSSQDLRLSQQIGDALAAVPGGEQLAAYFGIGGEQPQQPPQEAIESAQLIDGLRSAGPGDDLSGLLQRIMNHADNSGADPDALRALMRGATKRPG